ncbi:Hypothetical protein A7982_03367 [Minicystis rosea]|nr:Hypothetical protein A7982_03367 [Minicystis rosea]
MGRHVDPRVHRNARDARAVTGLERLFRRGHARGGRRRRGRVRQTQGRCRPCGLGAAPGRILRGGTPCEREGYREDDRRAAGRRRPKHAGGALLRPKRATGQRKGAPLAPSPPRSGAALPGWPAPPSRRPGVGGKYAGPFGFWLSSFVRWGLLSPTARASSD